MRLNHLKYILIGLFFAVGFFSQCARPAAPMGGPVDSIGPVLIGVYPANYTTNFNSEEIILRFNEYVLLKDIQKNVLISPPLAARPMITSKGRSVVVRFSENGELEPNTTYKIDFGDAIVDNNESNIGKRLEYIFSTGSEIDSLVMSGKLKDATTGGDIINGLAIFYAPTDSTIIPDSTIFIGKKLAVARTDSSGNFLATNLKAIDYRVFGLKDENGNGDYELGTEFIGFSNKLYNPAHMKEFKVWIDPVKDRIEVSPQFDIALYKEQKVLPQAMKEVKRPQEIVLEMVFAADSVVIDSLVIDSIPSYNILIENTSYNDSIKVWIKTFDRTSLPDTLKGAVYYIGVDSLNQDTQKKYEFALGYFKKEGEDNKTATQAVESVTNFFSKFSEWIKNLFTSRLRKEVNQLRTMRIHREDSIARVKTDSLNRVKADSLALLFKEKETLVREEFERQLALLGRDSLYVRKDSTKVFAPSVSPSGEVRPGTTIYLQSTAPLEFVDTVLINLDKLSFPERDEDSFSESDVEIDQKPTIRTPLKVRLLKDTVDFTKTVIDFTPEENCEYELTLHKDAIMDIAGNFNDSITFNIKTINADDLAVVTVDLKLLDSLTKKSYIVSLVDSTNNVIETKRASAPERVVFNYLKEAKYKLLFVDDINNNGVHDMGVTLKRIEPEKSALYYPLPDEPLFLTKKKWDLVLEIYPETLFDETLKAPNQPKKPEEEDKVYYDDKHIDEHHK